jgi:hypothetical protein
VRRFAVAALLPPANVERLVCDLQDRLFRELGLASAQALPAFAPLAALPPGLEARAFQSAIEPERAAFRIELAPPAAAGAAVVLRLLPGPGGLDRLSRAQAALVPLLAAGPAAVPFPLGAHLWLAEAASGGAAAAAARLVADGLAPLGFSGFEYAILEIEASDDEPWWRELRWRTYAHVRVRRGPPAVAANKPRRAHSR